MSLFPKKQTKVRFLSFDRLHDKRKDEEPDVDRRPTLKYFFKLLKRRFTDLLSLNLVMLFQIIPLFVGVYVYLSRNTVPMSSSFLYPVVAGAATAQGNVSTSYLMSVFGVQSHITSYLSAAYFVIPAMVLLTLVTFGWQNTGAAYVLRGMVRSDPTSLFADYFYAIKRNFKQSFVLGVIDALLIGFLAYDAVYFYSLMGTGFWYNAGFVLVCLLAVVYFLMRFYLYLVLVTFDLKTRKIIKDAFIFSVLGLKRNVMAVLGIAVLILINVALILGLMQFNIAIGLIIPIFYIMAYPAFMAAYAAFPVIKRYMIDPYYNEDGTPKEKSDTASSEKTEI